jgi:hypothetical protein
MIVNNKSKASSASASQALKYTETTSTKESIFLNVQNGSRLHQVMLKNPKLIFGHFNNMFKYDEENNTIAITQEFASLIEVLKSCKKKDAHKIGPTEQLNNFEDIRQALNNLDFNTAFGSDKNTDGSHVERWHLSEEGLPTEFLEKIKDLAVQLGLTKLSKPIKNDHLAKQAIILGARSERMELRIRQSLSAAYQNGKVCHEDMYFLSGDRKIDAASGKDELNFLSSLGIDARTISNERDAQQALVKYVCDDMGIPESEQNKFTFITGYSDDESRRANASDTTKALVKHAKDEGKSLSSIDAIVEQPYGRLADQLVDSLVDEMGILNILDMEINLSQIEKTYSIDDKAPTKIILNEAVKQYNRAVSKIEAYNKI